MRSTSVPDSVRLMKFGFISACLSLLATLILLPLSRYSPEPVSWPLFLLWLALAGSGSTAGILIGSFTNSQAMVWRRRTLQLGLSAALLFLAVLLWPIAALYLG